MDEQQKSWAERRAATRASWEHLIAEYVASGKTGAEYCRERGLPIWQFRYWLKALRQPEEAPTGFVELTAAPRDPGVWVACGKWQVHVSAGFDADVLRRVVEALA